MTTRFLFPSQASGKLVALIFIWALLSTAFWFFILERREYYASIDTFMFQPAGHRIAIRDLTDGQTYFELDREFRLPNHLREMTWDPIANSHAQSRLWHYIPNDDASTIDSVLEYDSTDTLVKEYLRLDQPSANGAAYKAVSHLPNGSRETIFFTAEGKPAPDFRGVYRVHATYEGDLLKSEVFKDLNGDSMASSEDVLKTIYQHSGSTLEMVTFIDKDGRAVEQVMDRFRSVSASAEFINERPVIGDSGYHRFERINSAHGIEQEMYFDVLNRRKRNDEGLCSYQASFDAEGNRSVAVWDYINGCSGMPPNELPAQTVKQWIDGALYADLTIGHTTDWLHERNKSEAIRYFHHPETNQMIHAHFFSGNRIFLRFHAQ